MQKLSSQSIANFLSEFYISDDGKIIYFYVNGNKVAEKVLVKAWSLPSITQSIVNGKLQLRMNDEIIIEEDLSF